MLRRILLNIVSIICLVACVALMGMWVRSYWWTDRVFVQLTPSQEVGLASVPGQVLLGTAHSGAFRKRLLSLADPTPVSPIVNGKRRPIFAGFFWAAGEVYVPYWFLILTAGLLSAFLGMKRLWRFSVRMLLIAITFVAVMLGMIA